MIGLHVGAVYIYIVSRNCALILRKGKRYGIEAGRHLLFAGRVRALPFGDERNKFRLAALRADIARNGDFILLDQRLPKRGENLRAALDLLFIRVHHRWRLDIGDIAE